MGINKLICIALICVFMLTLTVTPAGAADLRYQEGQLTLLIHGDIPERNEITASNIFLNARSTSTFFDAVYYGIINMEKEIYVYNFGITLSDILYYVSFIINNSPEIFAIDMGFGCYLSGETVYSLVFNYTMTISEYAEALKEYNAAMNHIISGMSPTFSELEKAVYLHNYLAANYENDQRLYIYDAYRFLTTGRGACQAYMLTFLALAKKVGLECIPAYSEEINHTWNIVRVDGYDYHLDVTHDDPIGSRIGYVDYTYMLISTSSMLKVRPKSGDWYVDFIHTTPSCNSRLYESGYAWHSAASAITYCGGDWYYVNYDKSANTAAFCSTDNSLLSENGRVISILDDKWRTDTGYGSDNFSGMFPYGTWICYSTPQSIRYYDTLNGVFGTLQEFNYTSDIYGCSYDGHGTLTLDIREEPAVSYAVIGPVTINGFGDIDGNGITGAAELIMTRRYILTGECGFNWGALDMVCGIGLDIKDLIRLKKLALRSE